MARRAAIEGGIALLSWNEDICSFIGLRFDVEVLVGIITGFEDVEPAIEDNNFGRSSLMPDVFSFNSFFAFDVRVVVVAHLLDRDEVEDMVEYV